MDEISQSLTPAKVPSTIIECVITLEEILGLEGGTSGIVKRVKFLEETIIGNVQENSGGVDVENFGNRRENGIDLK